MTEKNFFFWGFAPSFVLRKAKKLFEKKTRLGRDNFITVYNVSEDTDSTWNHLYTIGIFKQVDSYQVVWFERAKEVINEFLKYDNNVVIDWDKTEVIEKIKA